MFGHEPTESVLIKDRQGERPECNAKHWESLRAQDSKLDLKAIKAEVTALWRTADNGHAFAAALADHGYILVRGDQRDFCIIDPAGDEHFPVSENRRQIDKGALHEAATDAALGNPVAGAGKATGRDDNGRGATNPHLPTLPFHISRCLSDWPDCTLELRCDPCGGRSTHPPVKLLRREMGDMTFKDVLRRLRCRDCRRKPTRAYLVAGLHRTSTGEPEPDWAIELVGPPA